MHEGMVLEVMRAKCGPLFLSQSRDIGNER